jgi:lysozyme
MTNKKIITLLLTISILFTGGLSILIYNVLNKSSITNKYLYNEENIGKTNSKKNFGIDISHYQGTINWEEFNASAHNINYIFIRATMGKDGKDFRFKPNWENSKHNRYLRGAYHYYRPNENSVLQFENFKSVVDLEPGDLPPVLDIEEMSVFGKENLIAGILNWLKLAEEYYGIKPIVYTGADFYRTYLQGRIEAYPLWIAAYSSTKHLNRIDWNFHQFSDRIKVKGINAWVDGNSFNGRMVDLYRLCKPGLTLENGGEKQSFRGSEQSSNLN